MYTFLLVVNIVTAITMVVVILLQHGRGAELGASFGRGAQGSLVGGVSGSANFLSKSTSVLATVFFATALAIGVISKSPEQDELLETLEQPVQQGQAAGQQDTDESGSGTQSEVPEAPVSDY